MLNSSIRASLPWRTLLERIEKPMTGALLTLGLSAFSAPYLSAYSAESPVEANYTQAGILAAQTQHQPIADGVYLYGQSPEPEQIGAAYMVFEVNRGQVVGAFYMPHSSFDCFYGTLQPDQMALNVVNSYEQTLHPYSVALQPADQVALAGDETIATAVPEGFYRIETMSDNDQRILSTCQSDYQEKDS